MYFVRGMVDGPSALTPVFRYSVSKKKLERVTLGDWRGAAGEITVCNEQRFPANLAWGVNQSGHCLTFNKNGVTTAGRTALQMVIAPLGDRLAVLSADGEYKGGSGFFFFGSPPSAAGPRFHEVFRADSAERVGAPVQLANAGRGVGTIPCWAPDGRVVVYIGDVHEKFWFIETGSGAVGEP